MANGAYEKRAAHSAEQLNDRKRLISGFNNSISIVCARSSFAPPPSPHPPLLSPLAARVRNVSR